MRLLVLQRGHFPRTSGKTGTPGEQQFAIKVGEQVTNLAPRGWSVRLINADEPPERYVGDAFVAVHCDGSRSTSAGGASVGYRPGGYELAQRWKAAYDKWWPYSWRPDNYTANLAGYYGTTIAVASGNPEAIVIECGFLTNPTERDWLNRNPAKVAQAIWEAVAEEAPVEYDLYLIHANKAKGRKLLALCAEENLAVASRPWQRLAGSVVAYLSRLLGSLDPNS